MQDDFIEEKPVKQLIFTQLMSNSYDKRNKEREIKKVNNIQYLKRIEKKKQKKIAIPTFLPIAPRYISKHVFSFFYKCFPFPISKKLIKL